MQTDSLECGFTECLCPRVIKLKDWVWWSPVGVDGNWSKDKRRSSIGCGETRHIAIVGMLSAYHGKSYQYSICRPSLSCRIDAGRSPKHIGKVVISQPKAITVYCKQHLALRMVAADTKQHWEGRRDRFTHRLCDEWSDSRRSDSDWPWPSWGAGTVVSLKGIRCTCFLCLVINVLGS